MEPKKVLDISGGSGIIELSSTFVHQNEYLYINSRKIKPIDGYGDIIIHGSPTNLIIKGLNGEEWNYNAKEAAEMIRNSQEFHGQPIRLISCQTGALKNGIAQQIANELGVNILAPTQIVNVDIDGEMFLCDNEIIALEWSKATAEERNKMSQPGSWEIFRPKRK